MKPLATAAVIAILILLAAGAVYVIRFGLRVASGERIRPPRAPSSRQVNPVPWVQIAAPMAGLALLSWWFFFRHMVGSPDFALPAHELSQAFSANEVAAFSKYGGRVAKVTGNIESTGIALNTPWVTISSRAFTGSVRCLLGDGDAERLGQMQPGSVLTVRGKVQGRTLGDVVLSPCVLD